MHYMCNPVNVNYRYQFCQNPFDGTTEVSREAADPSMICFQGKYYIFASMTLGVWISEDLAHWTNHRLPDSLPLYDYAPDVRVMGEYVYFCASKRGEPCSFYRTKDILEGPYEEIQGTFDFWDPNLFLDDDGRVYFYWGCANNTPIYGVELSPQSLRPLGEKKALIAGDAWQKGYERVGEGHSLMPREAAEVEACFQEYLRREGLLEETLSFQEALRIRDSYSNLPYIEGAWMNKFHGRYYLQYACPGAQYDTYADAVYVSEHPLGPFELAENNPFSYKNGGFINGAGHGSTMMDRYGNLWHASTMSISVNFIFERRVGIWPAGLDADGELFCNQQYGDWPRKVEVGKMDAWRQPEWYLLSYKKKAFASSSCQDHDPGLAVDENVHTWWRAVSSDRDEWITVDLGACYEVHAVQVNFADDKINIDIPGELHEGMKRYIEEHDLVTRWILEGSEDGSHYFTMADKSETDTDLSHDLVAEEDGWSARFIRLRIVEVPYQQNPCISGLRVFGKGSGEKPPKPKYGAVRMNDLDMVVTIQESTAVGYQILWGHKPDKLYHSCMAYQTKNRIGALVKGQAYYVRVDAFNENGITEGEVIPLS